MATRRRTRRSTTDDKVQQALLAWSVFTWARDTQPTFFKIPHVLLNYLTFLALCGTWWFRWSTWWLPLTVLTIAGLLYTIGRAARQVPAQRKAIEGLYSATAKPCGHPRLSRTNPVDPAERVRVRRWKGPKRPTAGAIVYDGDSPAAATATRWTAEKAIEQVVGESTVFDYASRPGYLLFEVVPSDDLRLAQKNTRRWVESTISQLFPTRRGAHDDITVDITWGEGDQIATDTPGSIDVGFGAYDVSTRDFRDKVERGFDAGVHRDPEWIYDWSTPGLLTITGVDPGSGDAVRKRTGRKIAAVTVGAIDRAAGARAAGQVEVRVTRWVPEDRRAANTPVEVHVGLGTADFSSILTQQQVQNRIDQALETEWADRVWLHSWSFGADAALTLVAVPRGHQKALRKMEERRIRQVVGQKFKADRNGIPVDIEIHEWSTERDDDGNIVAERAGELTVHFGTVDVTKPETRTEFQAHFDSIAEGANDWRYTWKPQQEVVDITAVPPLPSYIPFPPEGSPECEAWNAAFRAGKIILGPAKGGYEAAIDLNKSPHTMVGGSTGMGKSVLLTLVLYGALMNPAQVSLVVVDPKVTDFTWTPGYPNVRFYAVTDARQRATEILEAVTIANNEMLRRQGLLRRFGVENLGELRRLVSDGKVNLDPGEIPSRLIIFFDEGGDAFNPSSDPDIKALQDDARTLLESIGMLGRAMEVNIVMAAQKPSKDNIGTLIRSQCKNKVGIGPLDVDTSKQVMGNNLCTRLHEGSPKGRGYYINDSGQELLTQTYFLPKRNTPDQADPTVTLEGVQERVAELLEGLGWQAVQTPTPMTWEDKDGQMVHDTVMVDQWVDSTKVDV